MNKRKQDSSTDKVEVVQSHGGVYKLAVEKFRKANPQYDAVTILAGRLGMGIKMLYAVMEGTRNFSVVQQDMLFRECGFPEGYDYLKKINFIAENK
jgi:hypothetical protein